MTMIHYNHDMEDFYHDNQYDNNITYHYSAIANYFVNDFFSLFNIIIYK